MYRRASGEVTRFITQEEANDRSVKAVKSDYSV